MENNRSKINTHLLFTILMSITFVLSIWRIRYGFGGYDEPFYLTVPHRLFMGDALLSDEWHGSQLYSILLFPFVALYELITKSTDGVILYMRAVYIICHVLVSIFLYVRLKNYKYGAIFASILYFLFTPYGVKTLSYNAVALDTLVLTAVFASTFDDKHKIIHTISGITFSMAVLCCPYMAVVYIIYCLCVSVHFVVYKFIIKKNNKYSFNIFSIKRFIYFSIGVLISIALFLSFVLSRASINEILDNIPYILFSDPEHIGISLLDKVIIYFRCITLDCVNYQIVVTISYILLIIILIIDKKRKQHRKFYLILSIITTAIILILFSEKLNELYYNAIMFPLLFTGITSYILCDKKDKNLFIYFFVIGLLYSFMVNISSNQRELVILSAISISNIASIIFTFQLIFEISSEKIETNKRSIIKKICIISVYAVMLLQGLLETHVLINHYYWEATVTSPQVSTTKISDGIAKGITVSSEKASEYYQIKYDLNYYKNKSSDKILFLSYWTWGYLFLDKFENASYSAWLSGLSYTTVERLNSYYKLHPDKLPKYIYIDKNSAELFDFDLSNVYSSASYYGYSVTENEVSYKLDKMY